MIYFSYFLLICYLSVEFEKVKKIKNLDKFIFILLFIILAFRYRTGGDFRPYLNTFDRSQFLDSNIYNLYEYINLIVNFLNLDYFGVNLIVSFFFTVILYFFINNFFYNKFLALLMFFPVFIMIYGFGSIRQGLAIAFFLSTFLISNQYLKISALVISLLFHFTSVIYFLVYCFSSQLNNKLKIILFLMIAFFGVLLFSKFQSYFLYYILEDEYYSVGYFPRNLPTFLSAFVYIFIYFNKDYLLKEDFKNQFLTISFLSIIIFPLGIIWSTFADRLMAYFLPLQVILIYLLYEQVDKTIQKKINYFICSINLLILYVWFFYADNSNAWKYELFHLPFKFNDFR